MKMLGVFVFGIFVAVAAAKPAQISHTQDTSGNYQLFYETADSSRIEEGFSDGNVVGTYTFIDKQGTVHSIKYLSSTAGFRAEGDDIPIPVEETEAVLAVRAAHHSKQEKQRAFLPALKEDEQGFSLKDISDLSSFAMPIKYMKLVQSKGAFLDNGAEIEAAKVAHFAAHKEALDRLEAAYSYFGICTKCVCKKNCN